MRRVVLPTLALLFVASPARAQFVPPRPTPLPAGLADRATLRPEAAVALSIGVPAAAIGLGILNVTGDGGVSAALVVAGVLVGPSAGNLAQGAYRDALVGGGLRIGGAALVVRGFVASFDSNVGLLENGAVLAGAGLVVVGTGYDIGTAGRNAARAHRRITVRPAGAGLTLTVRL